jgi:hypothetical protein
VWIHPLLIRGPQQNEDLVYNRTRNDIGPSVIAPIVLDRLALKHNPLQGLSFFISSLPFSLLHIISNGDLFYFWDQSLSIQRTYRSIPRYRAENYNNHLSRSDEPLQTRDKEATLQIGIARTT